MVENETERGWLQCCAEFGCACTQMELELSWQRSGVQQAYHAKAELVHSVS